MIRDTERQDFISFNGSQTGSRKKQIGKDRIRNTYNIDEARINPYSAQP